jgi:type III pantothenate kinase
MLRGCAVVATDVGGNREAVRHGETGLLVPPGDAEALAGAIGRLLDDPAARRALARRARAEAEHRFGWDACVAAHEELYRSALAAAGGRS